MQKYVKEDTGKPATDGEYFTNFGAIQFNKGNFWLKVGNKSYQTSVEWWLREID